MKLSYKIMLSFSITMFIVLTIVGVLTSGVTESSSMDMVNDSVATSATLASNHIGQQLKDYMDAVALLGKDERISNDKLDAKERATFLQKYVDQYGFTSGNILDAKGISINDGKDFSEREYFKEALKGNVNVSDINLSKITNTYGLSIAAPMYDSSNKINGVVYVRLDINFITKITKSVKMSENSYAYLVDKSGMVIAHPNTKLILTYDMTKQSRSIADVADKILTGDTSNGSYTYEGDEIICGFSKIENTDGWSIVIAAPSTDFTKGIKKTIYIEIAAVVIALIVVIIISMILARGIAKPINDVKNALIRVAEGDFNTEIKSVKGKNEVAVLQNTTASLVATLSEIMGEANDVLDNIANCNLTVKNMKKYPGDFNELSVSVNSIKSTLNQLILEVQNSVESVDTGSRELALATSALSQGTVSQASSIQTLADNLGIVVEKILLNSQREDDINVNLNKLDQQIISANAQMGELKNVVANIETMSSSIQKIVGTIDSIAFQTNILSLNASVEAARAGDMGSGFAVVAEEIRALAEKCSDSSKRTADLIHECIKNIDEAKNCADSTSDSLIAIVENSAHVATAFKEISADTSLQAERSKQIQNEINAISDVIQNNTATVEETAASTEVLSEQAMNLGQMVGNFKVLS